MQNIKHSLSRETPWLREQKNSLYVIDNTLLDEISHMTTCILYSKVMLTCSSFHRNVLANCGLLANYVQALKGEIKK